MNYLDKFTGRGRLREELAATRRRLAELEALVEQKHSVETALRASEAEVRAIVDALPDLVIRLHRDGTLLDVKSPSQEMLSRPAGELVGRNVRDTGLPEKVIAIHLWNMEAALRTGAVQAFEYPLEVPRGPRDFEGRTIACSKDEVLFVIRDITDSKRASEKFRRLETQLHQARRMEAVGRLAAGVAHNLNNLLAPILGYAELLNQGPVSEEQQGHLRFLLKAADGASELTQQLLAVGHEQEYEVRRIDLRQVVADYQQILRSAIRKDVGLDIQQASGPIMIEADPFQIQQVLLNLALNAQDAIDGSGQVVIDTQGLALDGGHRQVQPGLYGALRVSDTGSGIDSKLREKIFDPFFTTKEPGKGTGLGLASVLGIVQRHGGEVRLESKVGEGSTFEILFPLCEDAEATAEFPRPVVVPERQLTVLVVEDDEMVNRLVSRILRDHGYLVVTAAGGEECLHLVERHTGPIDLLLTDVVMPEMNGRELYERLATMLPGLRVLYMSGFTKQVLDEHGIHREDVRLVLKPFSIAQLLHVVQEALGTAGTEAKDHQSADAGVAS